MISNYYQAMGNQYKNTVSDIFSRAGITINGSQPFDPQIHDEQFYKLVVGNGSLGLGESYMEGLWDCDQLDEFFNRLLNSGLEKAAPVNLKRILTYFKAKLLNPQSPSRSQKNSNYHYNLSNEFFKAMLDKRMVYTCGYWKHAGNLDEAQEAKLELACQKLHLEPGMKVLDIGCGWGSFAKYAAENYDVHVTGINVSGPQLALARQNTKGLDVTFLKQDYRKLNQNHGPFDRVISLGMFEHVGYKNFRPYFEAVNRVLRRDGIHLLHTIGSNESSNITDAWLSKYIFPHSLIPSIKQIGNSIEGLFVMEDLHNFGVYYDHTLMAWYQNFKTHWENFKDQFDNTFYRMWEYYLLCCAGSFRARKNQLWQIILSPNGVKGGYDPVRF